MGKTPAFPTNPFLLADFYKVVHHHAYKPQLQKLTSYWTPRMSRIPGVDHVVVFGIQGFVQEYLIDFFNANFFSQPIDQIVAEFQAFMEVAMPDQPLAHSGKFISNLHALGYLPLQIKALPEGDRVPIKVPCVEISSTHPDFAWLVNYFETLFSAEIWQCMTSATLADRYKALVNRYYEQTVDSDSGVDPNFLCGDFSMRGMGGVHAAALSGSGHLTSFKSTACMPAISRLKAYYGDPLDKDGPGDLIGIGVASMEHSVMSSYGEAGELECFRHLLCEVFPTGKLSIVSDTYDYWNVLTSILPTLKQEILNREGKLLVRGDSGDPIAILCGDPHAPKGSPAYKGTVELLYEVFGGSVNTKGYKVLDGHIGAIYGDSITYERAEAIYEALTAKGFAISNCVLGIGSYTYQYNTRDTFGFALKATAAHIASEEVAIYKNPITDGDNFKKSQRGLCAVVRTPKGLEVVDGLNETTIQDSSINNLLTPIFINGKLTNPTTLREIRARLSAING